jgi:hypothetical protein
MIDEFLKTDISPFEVLLSLRPGAEFIITGISPEGPSKLANQNIKWNSVNISMPTAKEYEDEYLRLKLDLNQQMYQQLRSREYPPVEDYLDAVVKGDLVQQQAYIDACLAVKAKYPKPEEV